MTEFKTKAEEQIKLETKYFIKARSNIDFILKEMEGIAEDFKAYSALVMSGFGTKRAQKTLSEMLEWCEAIEVYVATTEGLIAEELEVLSPSFLYDWQWQLHQVDEILCSIMGKKGASTTYPQLKYLEDNIHSLQESPLDQSPMSAIGYCIGEFRKAFSDVNEKLAIDHQIAKEQRIVLQRRLANDFIKRNAATWMIQLEASCSKYFKGSRKIVEEDDETQIADHSIKYGKDVKLGITYNIKDWSITSSSDQIYVTIGYFAQHDQFVTTVGHNFHEDRRLRLKQTEWYRGEIRFCIQEIRKYIKELILFVEQNKVIRP